MISKKIYKAKLIKDDLEVKIYRVNKEKKVGYDEHVMSKQMNKKKNKEHRK